MSPTLKDLLPPDQQPLTVQRHDTVLEAIERLRSHEYNQLPVVDDEGVCRGEVITFDTIVQSVISMDAKLFDLRVKDATKQANTYREDDDLLTTLDAIQRDDFALILDDDQKLTGVVTTADTTIYFHNYAGDLMVIEGVEESVKEAIEIVYGSLQSPETHRGHRIGHRSSFQHPQKAARCHQGLHSKIGMFLHRIPRTPKLWL